MIKEVNLPEIADNVETGLVTQVLVKVGDKVELDQPLIELETDKAVLEVPSSVAGVIAEILVKPDDTIKIGQAIVKVETDADTATAKKAESAKPETESEVESPTADEPPVPESLTEEDTAPPPPPSKEPPAQPKEPGMVAPASPSVRRLARELGVDINQVSGTGPGGRISDDDVKAHAKRIITSGAPSGAGAQAVSQPLPDFSKWGAVEREKMSTVRRITAEGLSHAWNVVPHVTQFDRADVTELEEYRKRYGERVKQAGGKLTVTAILLKTIAAALKVFPQFNASVDMTNREIVYKRYYHIAVAVDTDRGLLVPVIRDVDKKNIVQLSVELTDISDRARNKKIQPDELEGGCFSISNQGGIGGTNFTPIVYWPQVAILGVSRSSTEAVWVDGKFEPRIMLPLSLSYDHRIIDGADAARFLTWVVTALKEPLLLSLEG